MERGERNISLETLEKIVVSLEVAPFEIFKFDSTQIENELVEKRMVIEAVRALMHDRNINEVKFIHRVAKDFINTVDDQKKYPRLYEIYNDIYLGAVPPFIYRVPGSSVSCPTPISKSCFLLLIQWIAVFFCLRTIHSLNDKACSLLMSGLFVVA
ncbi:hypothetical protein D3C76_1321700 [compost metagenome]